MDRASHLPKGLSVRRLDPGDVAEALALSTEIGWSQVAADWRFLTGAGVGYGCFGDDGRLTGTATFVAHGAVAWVGMVLVREPFRRRGIATGLVDRVLADIDAAGATAGLDVRPELQSFYARFGFRPIYDVARLRAERPTLPKEMPEAIVRVAPMQAAEVPEMAEYDARSFGADRKALLGHLHGRRPDLAFVARAGEWGAGYVMGRDGRDSTQLGPLVAEDEETAIALAWHALARTRGEVIVDALTAQRSYVDWLAGAGFGSGQAFVRMLRGRDVPLDQPDYVFSPAGLDFG